jgi:hypothetical protein
MDQTHYGKIFYFILGYIISMDEIKLSVSILIVGGCDEEGRMEEGDERDRG